jgi:hypothetical protein
MNSVTEALVIAVAFQISQVGNDAEARRFVRELDRDAEVGDVFANVAAAFPKAILSCGRHIDVSERRGRNRTG